MGRLRGGEIKNSTAHWLGPSQELKEQEMSIISFNTAGGALIDEETGAGEG